MVIRGDAAASLLFSGRAVMEPGSELLIDTAAAAAGAVWRIGDGALALLGGQPIAAADAVRIGLCDAVGSDRTPAGSETARDVAAALISSRGGDHLERAMFAWLFATGVPREGLTAFLEKRPPRF